MKILQEFKNFALRGNVIDLAVGVVIGAAFGKIVTSLVEDIIMPPLALLTGKVDFTNKFFTLSGAEYDTLEQAKEAGALTINYGIFINAIITFVIVAFAIFLLIKQINRWQQRKEKNPKQAEKSTEEKLLTEIRDLLKRPKR